MSYLSHLVLNFQVLLARENLFIDKSSNVIKRTFKMSKNSSKTLNFEIENKILNIW